MHLHVYGYVRETQPRNRTLHPQIHKLQPNPQSGGVWRWGLWDALSHEDEALMNSISDLIRGGREQSSRRELSMNQDIGPYQTTNLPAH